MYVLYFSLCVFRFVHWMTFSYHGCVLKSLKNQEIVWCFFSGNFEKNVYTREVDEKQEIHLLWPNSCGLMVSYTAWSYPTPIVIYNYVPLRAQTQFHLC